MNIKNILVPIDFSKFSDAAFDFAASLARDNNATLHLAHVKEPFHVYQADTRFADVFPYADLETLQVALEKIRPDDRNIQCQHWLLTGDAVKGILQLVTEQQIGLIVMGTHGRHGLMRVLMGSIAEGVLRQATCPVLTIKQPAKFVEALEAKEVESATES